MSTPPVAPRRFSLPRHNQHTSALYQRLPAELRLIILRNLMLSDESLPSAFHQQQVRRRTAAEAILIYNNSKKLSSQIMRVCQLMHNDAEIVLYAENRLMIFYESGHTFASSSHQPCGPADHPADILAVFDVKLPLPVRFLATTCPGLSIYVFSTRTNYRGPDNVVNQFHNLWGIIARFRKLELVVGNRMDGVNLPLQFAVHWVRDILRGKDVVITCFERNGLMLPSDYSPYTTVPKFLDFSPLLSIRCKKLDISNLGRSPSQLAYIRDIETVATSEKPVVDLLSDSWKLYHMFLKTSDSKKCLDDNYFLFLEMHQCALNYSFGEYRLVRAELIQKLKDSIRANSVPLTQRLTQELGEIKGREQELTREIAEVQNTTQQRLQDIEDLDLL